MNGLMIQTFWSDGRTSSWDEKQSGELLWLANDLPEDLGVRVNLGTSIGAGARLRVERFPGRRNRDAKAHPRG